VELFRRLYSIMKKNKSDDKDEKKKVKKEKMPTVRR
jgi:hypothetical protein